MGHLNTKLNYFKILTEQIADSDFSGYTVQYPPLFAWNTVFRSHAVLDGWSRSLDIKDDHLGLYIHIPFCRQKCTYCRYFSVELKDDLELEKYAGRLIQEAKIYSAVFRKKRFKTVYIGGGTPSLIRKQTLKSMLEGLNGCFDFSGCDQFTFEANPDFLDIEKLKILKSYGVNRLTIGVQSLDKKVLNNVNRFQTSRKFYQAFHNARKLKVKNINIDLMVGLPGQDAPSLINTLTKIIRLRPDMIHLHPFYPTGLCTFIRTGHRLSCEDMDKRLSLQSIAGALVHQAGYHNEKFDAPGLCASARNIQLSDAIEHVSPFLGLGAGAVSHASFVMRYVNADSTDTYTRSIQRGELPVMRGTRLKPKDEQIYFVTASLRYGSVNKKSFKKLFGKSIESVFSGPIGLLARLNKISVTKDMIYSKMNDIGEYVIFSKFFYDPGFLLKCRDRLRLKKIDSSPIDYNYLLI